MSTSDSPLEAARQSFISGLEALQAGRVSEAEACLLDSLRLIPNRVSTLTNLAAVQIQLQKFHEARDTAQRSVEVDPNNALGWMNLGIASSRLMKHTEALDAYDRALKIAPDLAEVWTNRGSTLNALRRHSEALSDHEAAIALRPNLVKAWFNKATTLGDLRRHEEAITAYEEVVKLSRLAVVEAGPAVADAKQDLGRYSECRLLHLRMKSCDWATLDSELKRWTEGIRQSSLLVEPFDLLCLADDPDLQLECARSSVLDKCDGIQPRSLVKHPASGRIKVAYLSPDFRSHPVSRLIVEMIESHDRTKFELVAFNLGTRSTDSVARRILASFDRVIDADLLTDEEIVQLILSLQIDIAVDLAGHTDECRVGIFERRCAPVQVNYLGYPGTSGARQIDYIIADPVLIPESHFRFYSEQPVLLPGCFQPNDSQRPHPSGPVDRAMYGLPNSGVVFCAFSGTHKIVPAMVDQWAKILVAVPTSVLWLLAESRAAQSNLIREFESRGVSADRLVFAGRALYGEYLNRYRLADLLLDTYPFNGGTTVSDALWMGLPVLTLMGRSFASRMAASLLKAVELHELTTCSVEEYVERAVELANDTARLRSMRRFLEENRTKFAVFQGTTIAKHIEAAFVEMVRRARAGLPVSPIALGAPL